MYYISVVLLALTLIVTQAWAQAKRPVPPPTASPAQPTVEVPRQLTLERAEEILLQNNLTIIAARYGVDIARAQRLTASVRPNPTLTLGAEQFNFNNPGRNLTTDNPTASQRTYTWRLDQLIERGRKRQLRTEAADFQLQAAEAQVLDTIRTQRLQLRQTFYIAVLARENVRVAVENLDLSNATERLIRVRVNAGDAPAWDLIKFQANKVQFQQDLVKAQLAYQQAASDLLALLIGSAGELVRPVPAGGTPQLPAPLANAPLVVLGDLAVEPRPLTVSREELREVALAQRPDVVAAQRAVEAAQRTLDLAYAQRRRDLDIAGEYQRIGGDNTVGVTLSVPLFVFNTFQGLIDQGLAQLQQATSALEQARVGALTDVEKAYEAYQTSQQVLQVYTAETLARAEESFRIARTTYRQGATSLLELQEAQRTLNQTRVAANQAHFDYRLSLYQLELATGRTFLGP
jgi:outer membrane protein, heavy metal efflux system